ncbi:hypothetical protein YC2023_083205 [Brassica napus]
MESTSRGGETYEEASKRDKRNSQGLMEAGGHVVKEIFGLQEKNKNCWTFFAAAAEVYGGRIHESVESVEMISNYEIRVSLEFSRVQESATVEGFHGVLGLNLHGISVAGGKLIYVGISARQREGCCRRVEGDRLMQIYLCVIMRVYNWFLLEWICENEELLVQGRVRLNRWRAYEGETNVSTGYHSCRVQSDDQGKVFIQIVTKEILRMRSLELQVSIDISWKFWRRRISRFVVTITTTMTSETEEETFTKDDLKARDVKMKNGEMKQSKKLLEDIAGIAHNCLTVCPSQEGTCGVLDIWSHHKGMLRQFPQEIPLASGQILIDGQGIEIMISQLSKGEISGILDKISQAARGVFCLSVQRHKVMLKCNLFKNIKGKSKTVSEIWSMSDFKGFQLIQGELCGPVQSSSGLKKIMKELQAWLKVELRKVRRDKRRQGDAEDEQTCSSIKRCRHKDRESNDLVNHIRGVFRYFIVDVVDPGSTPDVARCGRELGEQFLSHEQG